MNNFVITIAREYGSGGKTIGKLLAESLGVHYYDKELMRRASDESGINEALFAKADEKLKHPVLRMPGKSAYSGEITSPESADFVSAQNLFNYQAKVIREIAASESCVIVGRCADFVLKDNANVLRIYVHAPFEDCVRDTMRVHAELDRDGAEKFIRKMDKMRSDYYRYFTGRDWKNADNYDLCLSSAALGWDKCVALVRAYLNIKCGVEATL